MKAVSFIVSGLALCTGAIYVSLGKEAVEALGVLGAILGGLWLVMYGMITAGW